MRPPDVYEYRRLTPILRVPHTSDSPFTEPTGPLQSNPPARTSGAIDSPSRISKRGPKVAGAFVSSGLCGLSNGEHPDVHDIEISVDHKTSTSARSNIEANADAEQDVVSDILNPDTVSVISDYGRHSESEDHELLRNGQEPSVPKFLRWRCSGGYQVPISLVNSSLDPSVYVAEDITAYEKNLLHFYNTSLAQKLFGTRVDAELCPARELAIPAFQTNEVFVQTIIVVTEHFQSLLRCKPPASNMFKRKADSYRSLNAIINSPDSSRDHIFLGMIGIMFTDFILGQTDLQKLHIEALDIYLNRQGGMRSFLSNPAMIVPPYCVAIQYGSVEFPLRNFADIKALKTSVLESLRKIRHGSNIVSKNFAALPTNELCKQQDKNTSVMPGKQEPDTSDEWNALISAKAEVDNLIKPLRYDSHARYTEGTFLLSLLLALGLTIFELGGNLEDTSLFLSRLNYVTQKSLAPQGSGEGVSLTVASFAYLVDHVGKEVFTVIDGAESALIREVKLSSATIDALKLFSIMTFETRRHVIRHLRSWVVDTLKLVPESPCSCGADDGDLSSLSAEFIDR